MLQQFTPEQQTFIRDRVRVMKNEILRAIVLEKPFYEGGKVPSIAVDGFGVLHDFCDANELGGWCDDDGPVADERDRLFIEGGEHWLEAAGAAQELVHEWIVQGRMRSDAEFLRIGENEQIECLLDEGRAWEAHGMVDDLQHRVGIPKEAADRLREFLTVFKGVPAGLTREDVLFYVCEAIEASAEWARTDDTMVALVDELMKTDDVRATLYKHIPDAEHDEAARLILTRAPHHPYYMPPQPAPDSAMSLLREVVEVYNLCDPDSPTYDPSTDLITELSAVKERIDAYLAVEDADNAAFFRDLIGAPDESESHPDNHGPLSNLPHDENDLADQIQRAEASRGA